MKDYKYKTSFSAELRVLTSEETDKYLSVASLSKLKGLIPQSFIDNASIDLIPFAANGAVINRANKNSDSISTKEALEIYKGFISRPIDVEHKTDRICGHIINAGFSKFGSDELLTPEEAALLNEPFNLCIAGYIYRRFNEKFADAIEESNDPTSDLYGKINLSWELGFTGYNIVKGSKNLSEAQIITDPKEEEKLAKFLTINKGKGKDEDGNFIYRLINKDLFALGFGIVAHPAADVEGMFIPEIPAKKDKNEADAKIIENNKEKISNIETSIVNKVDMKILTSFAQIENLTDDELKETQASSIIKVVADKIREVSDSWKSKHDAIAAEESQAKKDAKEAKDKADNLEKEVKAMKEDSKKKESEASFNTRMGSLDESFNLEKPHRAIIAKQIRDLNDESFASWLTDFEVMNASKKKSTADDMDSEAKKKEADAKAAKDKKDKEDAEKDPESKAAKKQKMVQAAEEALAKLKESDANVLIPNTSSGNQSLTEKFAGSFTMEDITTKNKRK